MTPSRPPPEALDEGEPIPGSPRSRLALVIGIIFIIGIVAFLIWFFATHAETNRDATIFG